MTRSAKTCGIRLLKREALVVTSLIDHAEWNYRGLLGFVARQRFRLAVSLLPAQKVGGLLEIGYGSGVFMPELAAHAEELYGADVHAHGDQVRQRLADAGVRAELVQAPAEDLPFTDGFFDIAVAVSSLEFVSDLDASLREIVRVLKPDGRLIVVTPNENALLDAALKILTGRSAKDDFAGRRAAIVPTLGRLMVIEGASVFPRAFPFPVYRAFRLAPRLVPGRGAGSAVLTSAPEGSTQ